jgi:hypothetical protein
MNRRETVTWKRRRDAVSGSTTVRGGDAGTGGAGSDPALASGGSSGRTKRECVSTPCRDSAGAEARDSAGAATSARTEVTTARCGAASAGQSSAATSFASRFESWKKRGRTSARFSAVRTFESSTMLVKHSRPSRSGSTTSGNLWMSSAAVFR